MAISDPYVKSKQKRRSGPAHRNSRGLQAESVKPHVCDENCDMSLGFCMKARNWARWQEYKENPFPVLGKKGMFVKQGRMPGRG